LDENVVNTREITSNFILASIADNIMAREEIHGVYLNLTSENSNNNRITNPQCVASILWLSDLLKTKELFVNFIAELGFACLFLGASAFGSGFRGKSKCFCLNALSDQGSGGGPFPKFHSRELILDLSVGITTDTNGNNITKDLETLGALGLLGLLTNDRTNKCATLLDEIAHYGISNNLPEWAPTRGNVQASRRHYSHLYNNRANQRENVSEGLSWLLRAEANFNRINSSIEDANNANINFKPDDAHLTPWKQGYEIFLRDR